MTDLIDRARKFLPEELDDQGAIFDALLDVLEAAETSGLDLHHDRHLTASIEAALRLIGDNLPDDCPFYI